jgi:hypothetical protein
MLSCEICLANFNTAASELFTLSYVRYTQYLVLEIYSCSVLLEHLQPVNSVVQLSIVY